MPKTKPVADDLQLTILRSTDNDDDVKRIKHIAKYIIFTPHELGRFEFLTKALTSCTLLEEVQDQADKISRKI